MTIADIAEYKELQLARWNSHFHANYKAFRLSTNYSSSQPTSSKFPSDPPFEKMVLQLHEDLNFHYEAMRAIGTVPYGGGDVMEIFEVMTKIKAGDFESCYQEWFALAQRVLSTIDETKEEQYSPATLRNVYFRVSHYIFIADFFLHNEKYKNDPRLDECYHLWRKYFDKANALLLIPGVHVTIKTNDFEMPAMFFRAATASASNPRPTLIIHGGFESIMEETYHDLGVAALERDYNVILFEGPGHRSLVRQGHGFIAEWEKAVTPVVDYIFHNHENLSYIDTSKIGLVGMSLGGYLCARAAAFEPRLAAVICYNGVYDMLETSLQFVPEGREAFEKGDAAEFDRLFEADYETQSTGRKWFHDDLKFTFCKTSAYECYKVAEKMSMKGIADRIGMPAFVGDAEDDMFFKGQPAQLVEEIGRHATLFHFTRDQGAQLHCQSGALVYLNNTQLEWFAGIVGH